VDLFNLHFKGAIPVPRVFTAVFFLSFIPQFVSRGSGHVFLQFVLLGTFSVVLNTTADLVVIMLAGPLGKKIRSSAVFRRRQRKL